MSLERVTDFLKKHDPALKPIILEEKAETAADAARLLGIDVGQIAKSILFQSEDKLGLFVAAGDNRINPKQVKAYLGGKKPRIATPETVWEVTGFRVGAVCPFGLRQEVPIFVDETLSRFDVVYTAAGIAESLLPISFEQLVTITRGKVISVI